MEDDVRATQREPVLERPARDFLQQHPWPDSRAHMAALWNGDGSDESDIEEEWLALPGGDGGRRIRVRILRPAGSGEDLPVVLYLHGLGWMLTDACAHPRLLADLVLGADAAVVLPEYDLPEDARHPGAVERAYAVARWIARHGGEWRLDGTRMAVVGASAGGHQAAALTLVARERGGPDFRHQVLVCPVTDAAMDTPSHRQFASGYFLSGAAMSGYWRQYAPDPQTRTHDTVSPLRAPLDRLCDLPPALVLTAEADVLRDEGEAYAARLRAADVPVVSVRYHGTIHAFVLFDLLRDTYASRAARIQLTDTLHAALHAS
ncbi:alpha/beta hydrolase [Streptomyces sp. NBC_00287]|uniref:alpha/beta hydrolase n=1 Tax=Streptomyces sp. NBC_00287 TaxID=2975702 RepID=UPI002E2DFEFB|nr:alpha/beta hydrolase [Streptomyces sp. NBC_00287]